MKNIIVTGATSGIGKALSKNLLSENYNVYGIGRDESKIKDLQHQNFHFFKMDLSDLGDYHQFFENFSIKFDGLAHCAGIEETIPLSLYTPSELKKIFDINVFSGVELLRFFSKKKYANDGSSIVLLSSVMGELGQPGKVGYCATKAAVLGVVKSAALELAKRKIRVNAVSPGMVMTPLAEKLFNQLDEENVEKIKNMHPLGLGNTEDVVPLIAFLLSDKSKWITGQNLIVDGGYSIH